MKRIVLFTILSILILTQIGCSQDKARDERIMKRRRGGTVSLYVEKIFISSGTGAVILTFFAVAGCTKETV
jgi:hypothetical protein